MNLEDEDKDVVLKMFEDALDEGTSAADEDAMEEDDVVEEQAMSVDLSSLSTDQLMAYLSGKEDRFPDSALTSWARERVGQLKDEERAALGPLWYHVADATQPTWDKFVETRAALLPPTVESSE